MELINKAYVYILKCNDDSYYIGYTTDLNKRVLVHNSKKGAKYTKGRTPVVLIYYDEYENKSEAIKNEILLKKLSKKNKIKYIEDNLTKDKKMIIDRINKNLEKNK